MKKIKKIGALIFALVMCVATGITASAASSESYTIEVNPAYSGETYSAYKVFAATYEEDGYGNVTSVAYTIDSGSAWFEQVQRSGVFTLKQQGSGTTYSVIINDGMGVEDIIGALTPVPEGAVAVTSATPTFENNSDGSTGSGSVTLDVTPGGAGYYFVTTTLGSVVSVDTATPSVTVADKNAVPTITKEVENESHSGTFENGSEGEGTEDTAKVGDVLEFEITIANAAHKSALCLHDQMTEGLTYYGDGNVHIYLNSVSPANEVNGNYYIVQESDCEDGCDFEIVFDALWLGALSDDAVIIITYEAVVNENAVEINENDAFLTYGVNGRSVMVETETDTFGFDILKVNSGNEELGGATFTLSSGDTPVEFYYDEGTNTYIVHDAVEGIENDDAESLTTELKVGLASVFGLDVGTYTLTETVAPAGYNLLDSPITVTIGEDGTVAVAGVTGVSVSDEGGTITITVINYTGEELPSTGGMGTTIFYIVGSVIVLAAAVILIARKRISRNEG